MLDADEENDDLVVLEEDEERVDAGVLDQVDYNFSLDVEDVADDDEEVDDGEDGLAAQDKYVCCSSPRTASCTIPTTAYAPRHRRLSWSRPGAPYGFAPGVWNDVIERSAALRTSFEDADKDDAVAEAALLRTSSASTSELHLKGNGLARSASDVLQRLASRVAELEVYQFVHCASTRRAALGRRPPRRSGPRLRRYPPRRRGRGLRRAHRSRPAPGPGPAHPAGRARLPHPPAPAAPPVPDRPCRPQPHPPPRGRRRGPRPLPRRPTGHRGGPAGARRHLRRGTSSPSRRGVVMELVRKGSSLARSGGGRPPRLLTARGSHGADRVRSDRPRHLGPRCLKAEGTAVRGRAAGVRDVLRDAHPDHGADHDSAAHRIAELSEACRILLQR